MISARLVGMELVLCQYEYFYDIPYSSYKLIDLNQYTCKYTNGMQGAHNSAMIAGKILVTKFKKFLLKKR